MINVNKPSIPSDVVLAYKLYAIKAVFESQSRKLPDNIVKHLSKEDYANRHLNFCSELSYTAAHNMTINQIKEWVKFLDKRIPVLETELYNLVKDYVKTYNLDEEMFKKDFHYGGLMF